MNKYIKIFLFVIFIAAVIITGCTLDKDNKDSNGSSSTNSTGTIDSS